MLPDAEATQTIPSPAARASRQSARPDAGRQRRIVVAWHLLARILGNEWVFGLVLVLAYGYFLTPAGTNTLSRYDMVYAFLHGTTTIDQHVRNTIDVSFRHGHWYSPRSLGLSLLATPVLALVAHFKNIDNTHLLPITQQIVILNDATVLPISVAGALVLRRFVARLRPDFAGTPLAYVVAGTFALGTLAFPFADVFFSHAFGGALALIGFYVLYRARDVAQPEVRLVAAGFLVGLAVISEYPAGLIALVLCGYIWLVFPGRELHALGWFALGLLPSALALGWYDWMAFGNPLHLSYGYVANAQFAGQHSGFFGLTYPHLSGLWQVLFYPRGLLIESPVLIFVPLGLARWLRGHLCGTHGDSCAPQPQMLPRLRAFTQRWPAEALACTAICIIYPLAISAYYLPMAGENLPGPRLLVPMLPYACLALAWIVGDARAWVRWLYALLLAFSVVVSFLYVAVGVRIFHTYGAYPVTDLYWPFISTGILPRTDGRTPSNLGVHVLHLPPQQSLFIPIIALGVWLILSVAATLVGRRGTSSPPSPVQA